MGYLPQFLNGDATDLGKALVTATPTSDAARDLLGLGEGDRPRFSGLIAAGRVDATGGFRVSNINGQQQGIQINRDGIVMNSAAFLRWGNQFAGGGFYGSPSVELWRDGDDILAQRRETNPQRYRLYKTFTSATNFERLQFDTTDDAYRIGSAVGSTGGAARGVQIGSYSAAGAFTPWARWSETGVLVLETNVVASQIQSPGGTPLSLGHGTRGVTFPGPVVSASGTMQFRFQSNGHGLFGLSDAENQIMSITRQLLPSSASIAINSYAGIGFAGGNTSGAPSTDYALQISSAEAITMKGHQIRLTSLPTTDPASAGQIWNDNGTLKVSAG